MEKNKVSITISNQKYTVISNESPESVKKLGDTVDKKVSEIMASSRVSLTEALVLTALDLANEARENEKAVKKLKGDMAGYLEDVEKITIERDKLRRELDKLKK
ncbi:MAG: cell division protein ZapA [Ruminococcaceae bacterium]|nr:cell division protein ZapA [Oscillospiraceae bacterium]MBR3595415.1 cell division protein ZapA [Clostridia bacterium]